MDHDVVSDLAPAPDGDVVFNHAEMTDGSVVADVC
jgi:hypothetical protein